MSTGFNWPAPRRNSRRPNIQETFQQHPSLVRNEEHFETITAHETPTEPGDSRSVDRNPATWRYYIPSSLRRTSTFYVNVQSRLLRFLLLVIASIYMFQTTSLQTGVKMPNAVSLPVRLHYGTAAGDLNSAYQLIAGSTIDARAKYLGRVEGVALRYNAAPLVNKTIATLSDLTIKAKRMITNSTNTEVALDLTTILQKAELEGERELVYSHRSTQLMEVLQQTISEKMAFIAKELQTTLKEPGYWALYYFPQISPRSREEQRISYRGNWDLLQQSNSLVESVIEREHAYVNGLQCRLWHLASLRSWIETAGVRLDEYDYFETRIFELVKCWLLSDEEAFVVYRGFYDRLARIE